jgi:hypothetical protein
MKHFSLKVNPDGTTSVSHDPVECARWKAEKQSRPVPERFELPKRTCQHLGIETGKTLGCLCGNRGKEIPVFWCNRLALECTENPTTATGEYRICKRCDYGPWAEFLR